MPCRTGTFAHSRADHHEFHAKSRLGTPAPIAPTQHLIVGGPFRYVRNPMYLAALATILGQAAILGAPSLVLYAGVVAVAVVAFVNGYEEPTLRQTYGAEYEEYVRNVLGWVPRLRPWRP